MSYVWKARTEVLLNGERKQLELFQVSYDDNGVFTLTITGNRGKRSFHPVNTNGSQRGWRPVVQFLPYRVRDVEVIEDNGLKPVITDDFILVPNPREYDPEKHYAVTFKASPIAEADSH